MINSNLDKILIAVKENVNGLFDELLRVKKEVNQLTVINKNLQVTVDNREADLSVLRKQTEEFISEIENSTVAHDALKLEAEKLSYSNKEFESVLAHHQKELIALRKENKYLRSIVASDKQVIRGKQSEVYQLQALLKDTHQAYGEKIQVLRTQVADTSMLDTQNEEYQKLLSSYHFAVDAFALKQLEVRRLQAFISETRTEAILQKKLEESLQLKRAKLSDWRTQSFKSQIKRAEKESDQLAKLLEAKMHEVYALQDLVKENQKGFSQELITFRDDLFKYASTSQAHREHGIELEKIGQDQEFLRSSLKAKMNEVYQLQALTQENWTKVAQLYHQNKEQQAYIDELEYKQLELEEEVEEKVVECNSKNQTAEIKVPSALYIAKQNEVYALQALVKSNILETNTKFIEKKAKAKAKISKLKSKNVELKEKLCETKNSLALADAFLSGKQTEVYQLQELVHSNFKTYCEEKNNIKGENTVDEKEGIDDCTQPLLDNSFTDREQLELHLNEKLREVQELQTSIEQKSRQIDTQNADVSSEQVEEYEFIQLELEELKEKLENCIEKNKMHWALGQQIPVKDSQTVLSAVMEESLHQENQEVNRSEVEYAFSQEIIDMLTNTTQSTKTPLFGENESVNDFQYRSNFTRIVESLGGEDGDPKKLTEAIDNYIQQIDHCIKYIDRLI